MAFIRDEHCHTCGKTTMFINGKCVVCREREEKMALAEWKAKSIDEKLFDLHVRLLAQESKPTNY